MYSLSDYKYNLPDELIAQYPEKDREHSKLLHLKCNMADISHHAFYELPDLLNPSDVLVVNNTKVIPGRLLGRKDTGGKVEVLICDYGQEPDNNSKIKVFHCLAKASKQLKKGTKLYFKNDINRKAVNELEAEVLSFNDGIYEIKFHFLGSFEDKLYNIGEIPLPPYIKRTDSNKALFNDEQTYQTVYAKEKGAIAAPTAGLHFTPELFKRLNENNIELAEITLHVGYGTFLPVRTKDIRDHNIHSEWYSISQKASDIINKAKSEGRRIIAVGTTSVRTLEFVAGQQGRIIAGSGQCDLFIYPGYKFKMIDGMITNFHLPESSLLMLVSAFAGREKIMSTYNKAIQNKYRFFSYGDAMLID